ncbi:MAG: GTPase HflX [Clostridiaceae bacterium]|nr:GTPase HflX [Clostridiales bacterium]MDD6877705.1 GTPase HflX [Clostridiaceae bacterium]MDY3072693.1 GTPase HflX [Eubacteriales bacterium]MDY3286103.1 GTPase HflX [Eubacteriales bacterium]MDY5015892.1 GTPase HflX [Eubacteriales bacterium]
MNTNQTHIDDTNERAILAGVHSRVFTPDEDATWETLDELEELLKTAGGVCTAKVLQERPSPDPRSLMGEGKLAEIKALAEANDASLLIFDNELSPSQFKAIEEDTGLRVMDRAGLILDIFASRARTAEGKLQVELAQYRYLLPRLEGLGNVLSRLGGGIGTRGPGESKLESDRRHIRARITRLERQIDDLGRVREVGRHRRASTETPVAALVGYTNAGKSTLLNALTGSDIHTGNRLFDTLDTTLRRFPVNDTFEILISDTVGFIHKLPHTLIDAFRATLEELSYADLLLHVIDLSNPNWPRQAAVVEDLIAKLKLEGAPVLQVFNKADKVDAQLLPRGADTVVVSARTGEGLDDLRAAVARLLDPGHHRVRVRLPYSEAGRLDVLYRDARVEKAEYTDDAILVTAVCDSRLYGWLRDFIIEAGFPDTLN